PCNLPRPRPKRIGGAGGVGPPGPRVKTGGGGGGAVGAASPAIGENGGARPTAHCVCPRPRTSPDRYNPIDRLHNSRRSATPIDTACPQSDRRHRAGSARRNCPP